MQSGGSDKAKRKVKNMIQNKQELQEYLQADQIALDKAGQKYPRFLHDIIWKYEIRLRKCEYYENCRHDFFGRFIGKYHKLRFVRMSHKLGFSFPLNVFGKGLSIAHYGELVVSVCARVGDYCRIHEGVTIGVSGQAYWGEQNEQAPVIGNNVFIASGAKIIGAVHIADGVAIGANAVVVKDINEPNTTWAGVPAKKVSDKGSAKYIKR